MQFALSKNLRGLIKMGGFEKAKTLFLCEWLKRVGSKAKILEVTQMKISDLHATQKSDKYELSKNLQGHTSSSLPSCSIARDNKDFPMEALA